MKKLVFVSLIALSIGLNAQESLTLVFYNLLNYPQELSSNRDQILILLAADIFRVCELESENAANDILITSLNFSNDRFDAAPYVNNTSGNSNLQQILFFDKNKFDLDKTSIVQTSLRDINRYSLKLRTEEELFIEIFAAHLKASQGADNEAIILDMVEDLISYLDTIDSDTPVIFTGDFNLYSSTEPAYKALLDNDNNVQLLDPIDTSGDWNNNPVFTASHTQSMRISNYGFDGFGAGGGLDSRFDFILISQNIIDNGIQIKYVQDSYVAFGNNGNCFNNRIDDEECEGSFSSDIRNLLYQMSHHLPVVVLLAADATFLPPLSLEDIEVWSLATTVVNESLEITIKLTQPRGFISIYDQIGRLVIKHDYIDNKIEVYTVNLGTGIYCAVLSDSNMNSIKFIKVN